MTSRDILIKLAVKNNGDWDKIFTDIKGKADIEEKDFNYTGNALTMLDEGYPECLKQTFKPPFVLFYKGSISLLGCLKDTYTLLGSRKPLVDSTEAAADIIYTNYAMERKSVLVSGGATGLQAYACRQAMIYNIPIILVLPCGFDNDFLKDKSDIVEYCETNGLIITEYPNSLPPDNNTLLLRNRIIATISDEIIGVEIKSGSSVITTINYALAQGKDVYVLPQPYNSDLLNNDFIQSGALVYIKNKIITEQVIR